MLHPNELDQQIENLRTLQQSYDQIATAAEAYNTGKVELAANITHKGVQASATETLPELAEKVNVISQETYEINGGDMYAKQLFGALETPNYWNLYEILMQLLSDGRLVEYGGVLLAEYYKGYDSLALSGAGAGGAYVVSDKDADGQFIMYTEDTTHTWDTAFDGKGNRWVAYCFADEYHDFQITDTNTCPRSIFIGRKVGAITCLVSGRISDIVVPDGNELLDFSGNYPQQWGKKIVIRNISNHSSGILLSNIIDAVEAVYLKINKLSGGMLLSHGTGSDSTATQIRSLVLDIAESTGGDVFPYGNTLKNLAVLVIQSTVGTLELTSYNNQFIYLNSLNQLSIVDVEDFKLSIHGSSSPNTPATAVIYIGYKTNDKTKSVIIDDNNGTLSLIEDVRIKDGWCKPLVVSKLIGQTEANIYAHILRKLKQDEADCGDGITITLGATNLAKLTSAESVQLLDDLTNIYGYTFA